MDDIAHEKRRLLLSALFPFLFVCLIWLIKIFEIISGISLVQFGLYPLKPQGLIGILTGPLIHGDWRHLFNNTFPVFFLTWGIFYFYHEVAWRVFILAYLIAQFWLWFFAREAYHIGASSLIYSFGAFVFVSGIIRRNRNLLAISLLVAFLYGSMVWGIFPVDQRISWEGHLMGMIAGIVLAFYYKNYGPPIPGTIFDDEEDESDDESFFTEEWKEYETE
ncbi:MAG TPA: rhomboid family intramembrane serine protease [Bacteroidales bacterium]|jgi:membrane associated rhomboid family serine protease|nr:rhomboid family intramembrane serine protease [Bacteroidales bacterium]